MLEHLQGDTEDPEVIAAARMIPRLYAWSITPFTRFEFDGAQQPVLRAQISAILHRPELGEASWNLIGATIEIPAHRALELDREATMALVRQEILKAIADLVEQGHEIVGTEKVVDA